MGKITESLVLMDSQNCSPFQIPNLLSKHTKAAGAALSMQKECLKQAGSSGYMDGWQKDHEAFHTAVNLMAASGMI